MAYVSSTSPSLMSAKSLSTIPQSNPALTGGTLATLTAASDNLERWLNARFPDGVSVQRTIASIEDLQP